MAKPEMRCLILPVTFLIVGMSGLHSAGAAPRVTFDKTLYDFGTTVRVQAVDGVFRFSNDGDAELRVTNIATTCACTHVGIDVASLKPGESGSLEFSMQLGPSVGNIYEQIFFSSNDPKNPTVTLTLHAYVKPIFVVTPAELHLGDLAPASTTNVSVRVERTDDKKLRITRVESEDHPVSARIVPVKTSKGHAATILIRFKASDQPGSFRETVRVHTGEMYAEDIPKPSFEFELTGRVVKPAAASPEKASGSDPGRRPGKPPIQEPGKP